MTQYISHRLQNRGYVLGPHEEGGAGLLVRVLVSKYTVVTSDGSWVGSQLLPPRSHGEWWQAKGLEGNHGKASYRVA